MGRTYEQLSLEERHAIALLYKEGQSLRKIATTLDRSASTISRELKRNTNNKNKTYKPSYADELAWARRWRGSKMERNPDLQHYVLDRLAIGWSPQQVAGRMRMENHSIYISHESIYRFIYSQIKKTKNYKWRLYLPRAKSKRGFRGKKGGSPVYHIKDRQSIDQRSDEADKRISFGHWESDLMIFADKKHNLLVTQERKSRYIMLNWQDNKKASKIADIVYSN